MSEHENNDRLDDGWRPPEPIRVTRPGEALPPPSGSVVAGSVVAGSVVEDDDLVRQPRRFRGDLIVGGLLIALIAAGGLAALLLGRSGDPQFGQGGGPFFPPVPVPQPAAFDVAATTDDAAFAFDEAADAVLVPPIPPGAAPPSLGLAVARPDGMSDIAAERVGAALVATRADSSALPAEGIVFNVEPGPDGTWWLAGAEPGFSFQDFRGSIAIKPPGALRKISPDGSVAIVDTGSRSVASVAVIAGQSNAPDLVAVVGDGVNGQAPAIGLSTDQGATWEWSTTEMFQASMKPAPDGFSVPVASVVADDSGQPLVVVSSPSVVSPDDAIAAARDAGVDLNYESFAFADGEGFSYFDHGLNFSVCNGLQQEWFSIGDAFHGLGEESSFRSTVERNEESVGELRAAAPDFTAELAAAGCTDVVTCDLAMRESNLEFDRAQLELLDEYGLADLVAGEEPDINNEQRAELQEALAALNAERNEQAINLTDAGGASCSHSFGAAQQPTFVSWESLNVDVPASWKASTMAWNIDGQTMSPVDVPFSDQHVWSVVNDDDGAVLAIGPGSNPVSSVVWELADGEWREIDAVEDQFVNESGWVEVAEVDDMAFHVSFDFSNGEPASSLVQSDDGGVTWTPIDLDEIRAGLADLQPESLFAGDALIATVLVERSNFRPPETAVVLWTTDGISWEATEIDSGWASVHIGPEGALVVGQPSSPNAPGDLVVISPAP